LAEKLKKQKDFLREITKICSRDRDFKPDAYEFVMEALHFTQKKLKKETHVSGKELLEGMRELAIDKWGPMAKTVLKHWGIEKTQDIGRIVFNMIASELLSKTEEDSIEDFKDVYDFAQAFGNVLRDSVIQ
jgi:uncharacterized repeat protein (TIGR04138 family)